MQVKLRKKRKFENTFLAHFRPSTQYVKCLKVEVSQAGALNGSYTVSDKHTTSWAPQRQVYQHENKLRWDINYNIISDFFIFCSFIFWVSGGAGWSLGQEITNEYKPSLFTSDYEFNLLSCVT